MQLNKDLNERLEPNVHLEKHKKDYENCYIDDHDQLSTDIDEVDN